MSNVWEQCCDETAIIIISTCSSVVVLLCILGCLCNVFVLDKNPCDGFGEGRRARQLANRRNSWSSGSYTNHIV